MKIILPTYYRDFTCIAGACRHSCCIGWEIDIDEETDALYRTVDGSFGERLKHHIERTEGTAHFLLDEKERCPFLNRHGLCDIILTLGEDHLCQICSDHPRFRNFFSDRTEIGLGLCCEAAGNLILFGEKEFDLTLLCDDDEECEPLTEEEEELLALRDEIFSLLCNRKLSLRTRVENMLADYGRPLTSKSTAEWAAFYRGLECLEAKRDDILTSIEHALPEELFFPLDTDTERAFERMLCYFIFRHLPGALDDFRYKERASFAALSVMMIFSAAAVNYHQKGELTRDDLIELARLYSAEIEYSEENLDSILAELG